MSIGRGLVFGLFAIGVGLVAASAAASSRKAPVRRVAGRGKPVGKILVVEPSYTPTLPDGFRPLRSSEVTRAIEDRLEELLLASRTPGDVIPFEADGRAYLGLVEVIELEDGTREQSIQVFTLDDSDPLRVPVVPLPKTGWDVHRGEVWRVRVTSNLPGILAGNTEAVFRAQQEAAGNTVEDFELEDTGSGLRISAAIRYGKDGRIEQTPVKINGYTIQVSDAERVE